MNIGGEKKVLICSHPWCGDNNNWKILEDLIQSLRSKGINTLSDDSSVITIGGIDACIQAWDIDLTNALVVEWTYFLNIGIKLSMFEDIVTWSRD